VTWSSFDLDSALERDVLLRALPLIPIAADGSIRHTVDLTGDSSGVAVKVSGVLGPTSKKCVEMLALRPLLTGAAWKVLDLLVEAALDQAGAIPDQRRGWSINEKVKQARVGIVKPNFFSDSSWAALLATYVNTAQLRHSLVHRTVHIDSNNSLVGLDKNGKALRPLTADEQDAFARTALRAASLAVSTSANSRMENDLLRHLHDLRKVHRIPLPSVPPGDQIREIRVLVDPAPNAPNQFLLDLPAVKAKLAPNRITEADLVIVPRNRPDQELRGRWEDAPNDRMHIDPEHPPHWLR